MGLDLTISKRKTNRCPHCGEVIGHTIEDEVGSGGRVWYPILEQIGYYVPYEERTEENDWYGKDMILSDDQIDAIYQFVKNTDVFQKTMVLCVIASAKYENCEVILNADW